MCLTVPISLWETLFAKLRCSGLIPILEASLGGLRFIKSNFSPAIASWGILLFFFIIAMFLLNKAIR